MFWYGGGFWRIRLAIMGLMLGGTLLFIAFQEWRVGAAASATPEDFTLEALIARGPDGNPNVRVSDFMLGDNFVYFTDDSGYRWTSVLIPAVPKTMGEQSAHVLNPQVIVKSKHVPTEDDLGSLRSRTKMQGLVINRIEELGTDEKDMLRQDYPGLDFNKCLILEESRQPSEFTTVFLMSGGGLALLFGGGWLLLYNFTRTT